MAVVEHELNDDYDNVIKIKRLKAAVHYTVGKICEESEAEVDVKYTPQFIASLSEATFRCTQTMARDLEAFAKHGKRTTVNSDDVLLLARKTPNLVAHMQEYKENLTAAKEQQTAKRKEQKKSKEKQKDATDADRLEYLTRTP